MQGWARVVRRADGSAVGAAPERWLSSATAIALALGLLATACSSSEPGEEATGSSDGEAELPAALSEAVNGLRFTEVAAEAGLEETHSDLGLYGEAAMTAGASVADVDGDGDMDIFLPRVGKPNGLYMNDGAGQFTDVAREAGVAGPSERFGSSVGAFLDVDADSDLDLFVTGAGQGSNELFINDGSGQFTEESATRGLAWPAIDNAELGSRHHGVSVADVNGDGFLDLLVLQWYSDIYNSLAFETAAAENDWAQDYNPPACETAAGYRNAGFPLEEGVAGSRSALFLNDGRGSFVDATAQFELPLEGIVAFTGVFGDLDGDGWQDLFITGDGCTSRLLRNVEGQRFEDITDTAGVGTDENGMGAVIADVDGNGSPDLFITSISYPVESGEECPVVGFAGCSGNRLYLNNGDATFTDATDDLGLRDSGWGWGAAIQDFTGDGQPDVVAVNGMQTQAPGSQDGASAYSAGFENDRTRFWVYADGEYHDVAEAVGIDDDAVSHALVPFDMDGDGDLDILISRANQTPLLYRNDSGANGEPDGDVTNGDVTDDGTTGGSWLSISLDDPTQPGNRWGDGARVEITTEEGSEPIVGWVATSGSYESQKPPVVHRGFGDRSDPVAQIDVFWPGDNTPQTLTDIPVDQALTVERNG